MCKISKKYLSWRELTNDKTMKRGKIPMEYLLNGDSKNILWASISTPSGLENQFADRVFSIDKIVEFHWGKVETRIADITAITAHSYIRFRWCEDEDTRGYFASTMYHNELTMELVLAQSESAEADVLADWAE